MKTNFVYLIVLVLLTTAEGVRAQKNSNLFLKTPDSVIEALDSIYPGSKTIAWSKKRKQYRADFIYDSRNVSVSLNHKGAIVTRIEEIKYDFLPERIKEKLQHFYGNYKILMVLQRTNNAKSDYDIEVIQGQRHHMLNYNDTGHLVCQYNLLKDERYASLTDDE